MYIAIFLMASSGIFIAVLSTFYKIPTEFGFKAHPLTLYTKIFHHFTNIYFIFCIGKIFTGHIKLGLLLQKEKRKVTGFLISILIALLMFSGAGVLYASGRDYMEFFANIHWYSGVSFIIAFLLHKFLP
jgi:uncharacterized membrane protein YkvI